MINLKLTPTARALMAADIIGNPLAGVPTPSLDLDFVNSSTLDSRITFSRASGATYFDSSGVLQTAASGVARFDHNPTTLAPLGLLIEEQRTNSIRNNTMQGAVAGTPGTAPTNWSYGQLSTLTTEIVGSGSEDGIAYIDIRFSGSATTTALVYFEANSTIVATNTQTWATSIYIKQVGGSTTNTNTPLTTVRMSSSVGTNLGFLPGTTFALPQSTQRLSSCRFLSSHTTNNASTAFVMPAFAFNSAGAIDITLRIGLPQLELGAFATSVIPTTTAAATRNADVASMTGTNFSSWYRADEGTLYAEASTYDVSGGRTPFSITDGTVQNRIQVNASTSPKAFVAASGVTQLSQTIPSVTYTNNTFSKTALAYKTNDANAAANGTIGTDDTSITIPTVSEAGLGKVGAASNILNGTIRKIAFYRTRLSNEQLVALTR